jgi:hypothetical protein
MFDYILPSSEYNIIPTIEDYNFAKIDFIWGDSKESSNIEIKIINADNVTKAQFILPFTDLIYNENNLIDNDIECYRKINSKFKTLEEYFIFYKNNKLYLLFLIPYLWIIFFILVVIYFVFKIIMVMIKLMYKMIKKLIDKLNKKSKFE